MATTTLSVRDHTVGARTTPPGPPVPVWSVTKVVLATQVLALVDGGTVGLDDPVAAHLPDVALPAGVTVRRVLVHRAGLPDYGGLPEYHRAVASSPGRPWDDARFLALLADGPVRPPGTAFGYSNLGYLLLRRLVERVRGVPWADAVVADVLAPAGLHGVVPLVDVDDLAVLRPDARPLGGAYHPGWVAHGLLAADVEDLARLVAACLLDPRGLARRRASLVAVPVPPPAHLPGRPGYGFGVMGALPEGGPASGVTVLGHSGGGPGSTTAAYLRVDAAGDGVVVGAQASSEDSGALDREVAGALLDRRS